MLLKFYPSIYLKRLADFICLNFSAVSKILKYYFAFKFESFMICVTNLNFVTHVIKDLSKAMRNYFFLTSRTLFLLFSLAIGVSAQSATATLSGTVTDAANAVVSGATVTITDTAKAFERTATTNGDGVFIFTQLAPSSYAVNVSSKGFAEMKLSNVVLNVNDQSAIRIQLKVANVGDEFVNVETPISSESPEVSTVINRQFIENQPLNGRSFQTLVELSPGVVFTTSSLPTPGQFSVNGQRAGSNYLTVDGVSGNFGSTASVTLYETAGGGVPAYSALGSTSSLASVDAVQEFSIQTSTYAPEFGRQPGAQISLVTRSGTNDYHGNVFLYFRDKIFEANNFFNNRNGLERPAIRQYDYGFTLGGKLPFLNFGEGGAVTNSGKDRTFFFLSYEGIRARQPFTTVPLRVPSVAARNSATGILRNVLNAFPLPTGAAFADAPLEAPYIATFSNPSKLSATSLRIDHQISDKFTVFGRYNYSPSQDKQRARFCAASCVANLDYKTQTFTVGATNIFTNKLINDLRVNFSRSRVNQSYFLDNFGGAIVPPQSSIYPSFTTGANGYFYLQVDADGDNTLSDGLFSDNVQKQFNIVDSLSYNVGGHALKFGVDYRRLAPVSNGGNYKRSFTYSTAPAGLSANATGVTRLVTNNVADLFTIVSPDVILEPRYDNFSLFGQDTWRVNPRLTFTYGLRYEVNPAPSEANGNEPVTVLPFDIPANAVIAPRGTKFYETTYNNFAPRVGVAFQPFANGKTVVRGGFGVFYDLGYGFTGTAFSTGLFPYARNFSASNATAIAFTSPTASTQAPPNSPTLRAARIFGYSPDFKLPYTLQYNAAIEHFFGAGDSVSVSYVGARGRRLGRAASYRNVNAAVNRLDYVTNDGASDYNALQAHYQRRLTRGFQAVASYTFAKSLDNVSEESQNNLQSPTARLNPNQDRAPSSFDVRHAFNAAVSYEIPSPFENGFAKKLLGGFGIDAIYRARTATPVNVTTGRDPLGLGFATVVRPDLVAGQPIYIDDANAPGGRRFNRAAFDASFTGTGNPAFAARQGTLGRNVLRGFGVLQLDLALRRNFGITETVKIQLRVDAFNVFNRANFANPTGVLSVNATTGAINSTGNFGVATQTLNRGLGGLGSIYQVGGPRSFQVAAKLQF